MTDIVVTWPKTRHLAEYLIELERAKAREQLINFRIPKGHPVHLAAEDNRLYRVHNGFVRGWTPLIRCIYRGPRTVARVPSDPLYGVPGMEFWPEGRYLVCEPDWHSIDHHPQMTGFRGWRYFDRTTVEA
jgi:hypothetical protein